MRDYWRANQQRLAPVLFLLPGLLMFLVYVVVPIFQSVSISFYAWDGLGEKEYVGIANYVELMDDEAFYTSLKNNVIWLVLYMLAIPAGLFVALFLNQNVRGIRIYKSLFFFPFVISQVVVGLVFSWFYDPSYGLFNKILGFSSNFCGVSDMNWRIQHNVLHHSYTNIEGMDDDIAVGTFTGSRIGSQTIYSGAGGVLPLGLYFISNTSSS